jgi:hypothetical protein
MAVSYDHLNRTVLDKFGVSITYTPKAGTARALTVIIDENYVSDIGGVGIQTKSLVVQIVDADAPEIAFDDAMQIAGVDYYVVDIRPDYNGMSVIVLNKA